MPEILEVEIYRRAVAEVVGRRIGSWWVDERCADPGLEAADLVGCTVTGVGRVGKQMVLETDGPMVGMHFGMAGRVVIDDRAPIEALEYGPIGDRADWDRLRIGFDGGGGLRINDPRRWSRITLDPDLGRLGPDALSITVGELGTALTGRRRAVKAVLLDQHLVAGLGNLCIDEILWQADLAPTSVAAALDGAWVERLQAEIVGRLPALLATGGSHTGMISPTVRAAVPPCPRCGGDLVRSQIAGRTTVWCPGHQIVVG